MNFLLQARVVVIGRSWNGLFGDDHLVSEGDSFFMGEREAVLDFLALFLPVFLVGVFSWVDATLGMLDHVLYVARRRAFHTKFTEWKPVLDKVLVILDRKCVAIAEQFVEHDGTAGSLRVGSELLTLHRQ